MYVYIYINNKCVSGNQAEVAEKSVLIYSSIFFPICTASYKPFYIERDPHSRTEIVERDTLVVHKNEATVAWPEAIARHKPRRQSGVIKAHPPSHSTFP